MFRRFVSLSAAVFFVACYNIEVPQAPEENELAYGASSAPVYNPFPGSANEIAINPMTTTPAMIYPWGPVSGSNNIYKWSGSYTSGWWNNLGYAAAFRIAMDPNGYVWITMTNGTAWRHNGSYWSQMPLTSNLGQPLGAREIGINSTGDTWMISNILYPGLSDIYKIYRQQSNGLWIQIPGGARDIAVDDATPFSGGPRAWVVSDGGTVWEYRPLTNNFFHHPYTVDVNSGLNVPGSTATDIAVGHHNIVYVVGNDFDAQGNAAIWRLNPAGTNAVRTWDYMYCRGIRVAISTTNDVFVIKADKSIVHQHP